MIQGIITIAVSVLSATGILGIGTRSILNRMQKQDARQKALEYGVQALLRDRMLHCYNKSLMQVLHPSMRRKTMKTCIGSTTNWAAMV